MSDLICKDRSAKKDGTAIHTAAFIAVMILLALVCFGFCIVGKKLSEDRGIASAVGVDTVAKTVIIDAGHGGEDGGAVGVNGVYEKELNLDIALVLRDMLKSAGYEVIMTREDDVLLYDKTSDYKGHKKQQDLASRLKLAQDNEDAIFISIHMNSFPIEKYCGLQVYYSKNSDESARLAEAVQSNTAKYLQTYNKRKIKAADKSIYLLDRMSNPSILIECGFLSNAAECERLSDAEYRKKLSFVIFRSICEHILSAGA